MEARNPRDFSLGLFFFGAVPNAIRSLDLLEGSNS